jgi:hypothetical protein
LISFDSVSENVSQKKCAYHLLFQEYFFQIFSSTFTLDLYKNINLK